MPDEAPERLSSKALRHRAELLSTLPQHEAFRMLQQVAEGKERRMGEALFQRLMSTEPVETLTQQANLDRGFINGMRYLMVAVPTGAVRMLARADAQAPGSEPPIDFWSYEEMG